MTDTCFLFEFLVPEQNYGCARVCWITRNIKTLGKGTFMVVDICQMVRLCSLVFASAKTENIILLKSMEVVKACALASIHQEGVVGHLKIPGCLTHCQAP